MRKTVPPSPELLQATKPGSEMDPSGNNLGLSGLQGHESPTPGAQPWQAQSWDGPGPDHGLSRRLSQITFQYLEVSKEVLVNADEERRS